ncbi:hypothetical protein KAI92_02110 [Candidatus Parcubacteria bacterium]|nr:hypothetical protein [Candidatus Parcubacteria bacterium]
MKKQILIFITLLIIIMLVSYYLYRIKYNEINNNQIEQKNNQEQTNIIEKEILLDGTDVTDWKICKNESLGLQLKYPSNWGGCITSKKESINHLQKNEGKEEYRWIKSELDYYFKAGYENENYFILETDYEKNKTYLGFKVYKKAGEFDLDDEIIICRDNNNDSLVKKYGCKDGPGKNECNRIKMIEQKDDCIKKDDIVVLRKFDTVASNGNGYGNIILTNENEYNFNYFVMSTIPTPEETIGYDEYEQYVDGIDEDDRWNILKTIELIEN